MLFFSQFVFVDLYFVVSLGMLNLLTKWFKIPHKLPLIEYLAKIAASFIVYFRQNLFSPDPSFPISSNQSEC